MMLDDDIRWIRAWYADWLATNAAVAVAGDGSTADCIAREIWVSEPDDAGWVEWKPVPSTLDRAALDAFEAASGLKLPQLAKAYFLAHCVMSVDTGEVVLPEVPPEDPLLVLKRALKDDRPLLDVGLLPFGSDSNDAGPVCLDIANGSESDCPVLVLDNNLLREAMRGDRKEPRLASIRRYDSLRDLLGSVRS